MTSAAWVTLVAALVAAAASLYAAVKSHRMQLDVATRTLAQERDLQLRPRRAELYAQLVRELRGVGRINPPSTRLSDDARAAVSEMFVNLAQAVQERYVSASAILAEVRVHASQPVREAAESAVSALGRLQMAWAGVLVEIMAEAEGRPSRLSERIEGDVQVAQDDLTNATSVFEAAVRNELTDESD